MTNHSTALRETKTTNSVLKDDRRSPFFNPTKKLSKALAKSLSLAPLHNGPSSRPSGRSSTISSRETASSAPSVLSSPLKGGADKSNTSKAVSPKVVSSILDGMYAYPTGLQTNTLPPRPTRQILPASPLLNNFPNVSMTMSHAPSASSETRSQYSVGSEGILSSTNNHGAAETSDPRLSQDTNSSPLIVDSSIPTLGDCSASASSALHGSSSQTSSSNISESSSSSGSSSTSTLRVVGRGGSGSRLRIVTSAPENLNPARVRKDQVPVVRPIGRGGLGSRPKPLEASSLPSRDALRPVQVSHEQLLIRPVGRGGLGSRQKPLKNPPKISSIFNKRSAKDVKGKGRSMPEPRTIHPIPPEQSWRISGGTTSTLSSLHFIGDSDHPPYVSPFSPTNESKDSMDNDRPIFRPRSASDPSLSSFSFPASQSSSTTITDDEGELIGENNEGTENTEGSPTGHRQRSLDKLTRTLGDIPPDVFDALNRNRTSRGDHPSKPFLDLSTAKRDKDNKVSRRSSLSVTSLSSLFARPSSRRRDSVASHYSASTITDDLHRFPIEDDFSGRWGRQSDSVADSGRSPSPESPIMFAPPSPAPAHGPTSQNPGLDVSVEPEQEDDPYVPSPTLSRSLSYTPLSRRRSAVASHSHSASASLITARSDSPAITSNWMIPPYVEDEEVVFTLSHHGSEKQQIWTGEWNGDLQHVIKSLRTLR